MKRLILTTALVFSCPVWADAPMDDRSIAAERVEAAQLRADLAWRELDTTRHQVTQAQQDLSDAENADRLAQQRALETARKLQDAHDRLSAAQESLKQAEAAQQDAAKNLDQVWGGKAKPR